MSSMDEPGLGMGVGAGAPGEDSGVAKLSLALEEAASEGGTDEWTE